MKYIKLFNLIIMFCFIENCAVSTAHQKITNIFPRIDQSIAQNIKIDFEKNITQENLQILQALSQDLVLVTSATGLFKATNDGNDWVKVKLDLPEGGTIKNAYALNENIWWILIEAKNNLPDSDITENRILLLRTEDGGDTWECVYENTNIIVFQIYFTADAGWIVGSKYSKSINQNRTSVILRTNDKGKSWTDLSENLKKSLNQGWDSANELIVGISVQNFEKVSVLSNGRRIITSLNNGNNWSYIQDIPYEKYRKIIIGNDEHLADLTFQAFGLGTTEDSKLWVAGNLFDRSLHTIHLRGELSLELEKNSWMNLVFNEFKIKDVKFLPNRNIVICGVRNHYDSTTGEVLISSNGGISWETLYTNPNEELNKVSVLSENSILVIGDNGKCVKLELCATPKNEIGLK